MSNFVRRTESICGSNCGGVWEQEFWWIIENMWCTWSPWERKHALQDDWENHSNQHRRFRCSCRALEASRKIILKFITNTCESAEKKTRKISTFFFTKRDFPAILRKNRCEIKITICCRNIPLNCHCHKVYCTSIAFPSQKIDYKLDANRIFGREASGKCEKCQTP